MIDGDDIDNDVVEETSETETEKITHTNSRCSRQFMVFRSKRLPFPIHEDQQMLDWIVKNQLFTFNKAKWFG